MAHGWVTLVSPGHALHIVKYVDTQNSPKPIETRSAFSQVSLKFSVCVCVCGRTHAPGLFNHVWLFMACWPAHQVLCPWNFLARVLEWAFAFFLLKRNFSEVQRFEICLPKFCVRKVNQVTVSTFLINCWRDHRRRGPDLQVPTFSGVFSLLLLANKFSLDQILS